MCIRVQNYLLIVIYILFVTYLHVYIHGYILWLAACMAESWTKHALHLVYKAEKPSVCLQ